MKRGRLAFLTGTHVVNDLYQGAVPALLPFLTAERHYSYTAVSGIALAAGGLSSLAQPLFGLLVDRRHRGWLIPGGFLTAAGGLACAGLAGSYPLTWLCVALAGIGIAAYHPPATNEARAAGGQSQRAMSLFSVGGTLGASLAPALVTLVVGSFGLAGSWLLAVPALVTAALWAAQGPWLRHRGHTPAAPATARGTVAGGHRDDWRAFRRLAAATVAWSVPYVTVTSMLALHIHRDLNASTAVGATALTLLTLAGAAGTLLGGWLGDRYGRTVPIRAGYLLAVPALAALAFAPSAGVAVVAAALFGLTMFLPFASQVTLAQDYLPTRPGTAGGLTLGLAMSVGALAAPALGRLADAQGLRTVLALVLGVLLVALGCALRLRDRVLPTPTPTPAPAPAAATAAEPVSEPAAGPAGRGGRTSAAHGAGGPMGPL
ncbi:MFS transporter [Streptomyces sp. HF10]|uniref:MFS transporter n=1 Tax=Streptomyces sp. HF10 TaxID=2692233 RepID=UPI0013191F1B|nr:MFS transporter [Streptomyces sp. HF10]QHC28833.1 MFS transporter [Streptomyces sp. HF10]